MKKKLFLIACMIGCLNGVYPQDSGKRIISPIDLIKSDMDSLCWFQALQKLRIHEMNYQSDWINQSMYFQAKATVFAFLGMPDSALYAMDRAMVSGELRTGKRNTDDIDLSGFTTIDAKDYILSKSRKEKVLMFNEAHTVPKHRLFLKSLLPELYKQGYRYLALEALFYSETWGFREQSTERTAESYAYFSYYMKEPCFAELIREAIRLGYTIYGYEPSIDGNRDSLQAVNLIELLDNRSAKIVVLGGHGNTAKGGKNVYSYFKELSGITPVTINQTTFCEHTTEIYERPIYVKYAETFSSEQPVVLRDTVNDSVYAAAAYDISIFSPRTNYSHGRADWLAENGLRVPVKLDKIKKPSIIKAYPFDRMPTKKRKKKPSSYYIPVDIIVIENIQKQNDYHLLLPKGIYLIEHQNLSETKVMKNYYMEVK